MSIPKEPRQLMINLMYLVLTAMLALNVSSEILNAFRIINRSIGRSNQSIEQKNIDMMGQFQANMELPDQKARIEKYYEKAQEVREKSKEIYTYLDMWKDSVIRHSGGYAKPGRGADTTLAEKEDDIDAGTYLLVEKKGGDAVKSKLQGYRDFLLSQLNEANKTNLSKSLAVNIVEPAKAENNPQGDWSYEMFHYVPTTAVITLFAKLQNDVRVSEAQVLDRLFDEANAKTLKFDAITALAIPTTSYALQGQPIEASIMFAAYNKSVKPDIRSSSGSTVVTDGVGLWKGTATGTGLQTVSGTLSLDVMGEKKTQPWKFQYMVGSAGASVQLDNMNVFYIGLDNPITISASGYNIEDVYATWPSGAIVAGASKGKYVVRPAIADAGKTMNVTVMAKSREGGGGAKAINATPVRIKRVPDPHPEVAQKKGGGIPNGAFRAQIGINAVLENFEFDARFVVVEYDFSYKPKRGGDITPPIKVRSNLFSANGEVSQIVKSVQPGDRVFIDDIKAKGPDGSTRNIGSLTFTIF